jgi:pimeloyl-ACP methyl ester carboxylesterase
LDQVVGESAHLIGVSDGGIVGLLLALQRPRLLRRLVTVGSNFHPDGLLSTTLWTDAGAMTSVVRTARALCRGVARRR